MNPYDKHQFATQPDYSSNSSKIEARKQLISAYREITGKDTLPSNKGYWTLCNWQPKSEGSEIVQLVNSGLIEKHQFFGVDNDLKNEGIIDFNKSCHPEANWFLGDWIEVVEGNYDLFNPGLVYFDYNRTVSKSSCHICVARTMNMCPSDVVFAANLMLSDGHSKRKFDPKTLIESIQPYLRSPSCWVVVDCFYSYKASRTDMGTFIFCKDATTNETAIS